MQDLAEVAQKLRDDYSRLGSWDLVAQEYGLTKPLVWQVALHDHEPTKIHIRRKLGLPHMKPAPACPHCGEVPLKRKCGCRSNGTAPRPRQQYTVSVGYVEDPDTRAKLLAIPPAERLRRILDGMED